MSRETKPFYPTGKTIMVQADAVAPTGVATSAPNNKVQTDVQYRVQNNGAETIWYAFGADAATAQTNAVVPTGATTNSKDSYPLAALQVEVISAPRNSYFSGITATNPAKLYVTPGEGL